ncbi:LysR substrate-binding domain-containing protein [Massilia endophytica]|uniref:LysR substrate-binding domain-containing protein n=1 Tax=Massilia endophytica TaxID=2899220 RepID=UPI001E578E51|nr:LysR substrate-binding domain-containing protein [Massilia endophytica]UGQ48156.1 LysR substrate-binding domain-containing protein [Massilia endophytica]
MAEDSRSNPPLTAARTFEAAARHRSFQRAAAELNVTPAAVSHQVKRLEEYLGVTLFKRSNRLVEPTEEGVLLAQRLGEHFVALEALLPPNRKAAPRPLRVTVMPSLAAKWLAPRMADFHARFPEVATEISDDDASTDFTDNRFDIALRYGDGNYPKVQLHSWMEAPVVAVCSPELLRSAEAPRDLLTQTLIHDSTPQLPGAPPGWPEWFATAAVQGTNTGQSLRFSSVYIALEAARAGRGFAVAPLPLVIDDLKSGTLAMPFDLQVANPCRFWIVQPLSPRSVPGVEVFIAWLKEQAVS